MLPAAYNTLKGSIDEGSLTEPSIRRVYDQAELWYNKAQELIAGCDGSSYVAPALVELNMTLAISYMGEASMRQQEIQQGEASEQVSGTTTR